MTKNGVADGTAVHRYEAVLCIFLGGIALLWRDDALFKYPEILHLFALLLGLNLLAAHSLRLFPRAGWLAAAATLANCGTVTGILAYSGGFDSRLWALYLLPIYTAAMLLSGRELLLVAGGAVLLNASYHVLNGAEGGAAHFMLALKSGVLVLGAAATGLMARRERAAFAELAEQRLRLSRLSERVESQERNLRRAEGLAEAGLVAAGVAHDLNNALTVIQGAADLLETGGSRDQRLEDLGLLRRSAGHAKAILAGMLDAVKDRGLSLAPGDAHEILEECALMVSGAFRAAGVELRLHRQDILPQVDLSRPHLERAFLNLMANAKDAMPSGGTLDIWTETIPGPDPRGPRTVQIVFEDTGPGIPAEALRRLFKPLETTKGDKGTGLGLYLCREIAVRHGGGIHAENRRGGGARFVMRLPPAASRPALPAAS